MQNPEKLLSDRFEMAATRGEAGAVLSVEEMAFHTRLAKWNAQFVEFDAVLTAAERWEAYKRWLLTPTTPGPRMDITDDASLNAFADKLIENEKAATKAAEVIRA